MFRELGKYSFQHFLVCRPDSWFDCKHAERLQVDDNDVSPLPLPTLPPPTQSYHSLLGQQMPLYPPCLPFLEKKKNLNCHFIPTEATKWKIKNRNYSPSSLCLQILEFHNGHIQTLLIHKELLFLYRRCPLMIPYLHNTKDCLAQRLWNAQGCIFLASSH